VSRVLEAFFAQSARARADLIEFGDQLTAATSTVVDIPDGRTQAPPPTPPSSRRQAVDLFGLPGSKHPTPEFAWQQLPEKTRETVTGLMARLLIDHQRRDRGPSSTGRRGDV
jgi:hypothetical protein